jgi:VanZ family protein
MKHRVFVKYWLPAMLWVSFIFWMSTATFAASNTSRIIEPMLRFLMPHISETEVQLIHGVIRKLAHLTEYFILGLFLFRAFRGDSANLKTWRWAFYALLAVVLFAAGDEFHQSFEATRTASVVDVGIDTAGGFLAQCAAMLWRRYHQIRG